MPGGQHHFQRPAVFLHLFSGSVFLRPFHPHVWIRSPTSSPPIDRPGHDNSYNQSAIYRELLSEFYAHMRVSVFGLLSCDASTFGASLSHLHWSSHAQRLQCPGLWSILTSIDFCIAVRGSELSPNVSIQESGALQPSTPPRHNHAWLDPPRRHVAAYHLRFLIAGSSFVGSSLSDASGSQSTL